MKRYIVALIFGNLGRLFNNPQWAYRLEDKLANSEPVRQLARTIVGLYQRGSWEIKQIKLEAKEKRIGEKTLDDVQAELQRRMKLYNEAQKKKLDN